MKLLSCVLPAHAAENGFLVALALIARLAASVRRSRPCPDPVPGAFDAAASARLANAGLVEVGSYMEPVTSIWLEY